MLPLVTGVQEACGRIGNVTGQGLARNIKNRYSLTVSLLAYPITAFLVPEPWGTILRATFVPHIEFTPAFFYVITAVIGTTITPYMFFWQTSQEVEENQGRKTRRSLRDLRTGGGYLERPDVLVSADGRGHERSDGLGQDVDPVGEPLGDEHAIAVQQQLGGIRRLG